MGTPKIGRSGILLGIVVFVAIIMVVALFLSQLQGFSLNSNLPNSEILQINGLGRDPKLDTLIVYVENIGSEARDIISEHVFEVNNIKIPLTDEAIDKRILDPEQIATVNIPFKISPNMPIVVRIIGDGSIFAESKIDNSDSLLSSYVLSVNIQGNSSNKVTKIPDQLSYPSGSSVSLLAEPGVDWSFSDWSGDVSGIDNPLSVVIDSNKNIYANFVENIAPPIDVDPPDDIEETVKVTFSLTGIDSSSARTILTIDGTSKSYSNFPVSLNIVKGSFLNYEFSESVVSSISGERFALKSIIGPKSPLSAVNDVTILAKFEKQYEVVFSLSPDIVDATTQPEGIQWINAGKEVLIDTTTSSSKFVFSFWNTSNSAIQFDDKEAHNTSIVVNGPGNIYANYKIPKFLVSFDQRGIDGLNALPSVSYSIDGGQNQVSTVPFEISVDLGSNIEYSYQKDVFGDPGTRYKLFNVNNDEKLTITEAVDIVGRYKTQYLFEVFSPVGPGVTGEGWYDDGVTVSSSVNSPVVVVGPPQIVYNVIGYIGTGSAPNGNENTVQFVINEPSSITWAWAGKITLYPDGSVQEGIPFSVGSDEHWRCVADHNAFDNDTYVSSDIFGIARRDWAIDYYSLQNTDLSSGTIEKVTVFTKGTSSLGDADIRNYLILDEETRQKNFDLSTNWEIYGYTADRPGNGDWTWEDINDLQCGVGLRLNDVFETVKCTLVWVEIEFTV